MDAPAPAIRSFELLDELGRGAHSVVYRVRHGDRYYALKLPLEGATGAKRKVLAERFRREAVTLARIRHPTLPLVMAVGEADRTPYIVMELVTGETLAERLRHGPLTEVQAVELGRHLAGALAHIHDSGLVHRDVKPRNILFDADTSMVRLVDFGFAVEASTGLGFTGPAGTWAYAAPEQFSARRTRIDGRTDLYALGCVLYECVAGSPPFREIDTRRQLYRYSRAAAPPLDTIVPEVSTDFAAMVGRLLEPAPDDRYGTAAHLLEDLDRLHRGESLTRTEREPGVLYTRGQEPGPPQVPLFGREAELHDLRETWIEACLGPGRAVLLTGPSGVGKSRLASAFAAEVATTGRLVLATDSYAEDPKPFSAVRQLLEAYVDGVRRLPVEAGEAETARLRQLAGDLAPLLTVLSPRLASEFGGLGPVPSGDDAHQIFVEGIAEFLARLLTKAMPATVVVDNVQWLDASSRRVFKRVMDRAATTRAFFLFVARTDVADWSAVEDLVSILPAGSTRELKLGSLDERHVIELIQSYLGDAHLDATILQYVAGFSNGLPLSVLDVLRALLEGAALVPQWGRWKLEREALSGLELPVRTLDVLAHRLATLDSMTHSTLRTAAVLGDVFDDDLLIEVNGLEVGHTSAALADARRALLVQGIARGRHRFVHHSVREALLRAMPLETQREIHQRIAEALDSRCSQQGSKPPAGFVARNSFPASDPDKRFSLATHYAHGVPGQTPERVFETNYSAGELAYGLGDNQRALEFWQAAREAALLAAIDPGSEFEVSVAEAELRNGALPASLERFQRVLEQAHDPLLRARVYSRIAWIRQSEFASTQAWTALEQAFRELGEDPPTPPWTGIATSVALWLGRAFTRPGRCGDPAERRRLEVLSALFYQVGRLAFEGGEASRFIQAALRGLRPAECLGPSEALAKSYVSYNFVLLALGLTQSARHYLNRADVLAGAIGDPVTIAHCVQARAALLSWTGDVQGALEIGECVFQGYGHWLELAEYCMISHNQQLLEGVRGRGLAAWRAIERLIQRVDSHGGKPTIPEYVPLFAEANLINLGRKSEVDSLLARLRAVAIQAPKDSTFLPWMYGPRARLFTETGDIGPGFEALVNEVGGRGFDPRRVHLAMAEYYIHVAHARVHVCLRVAPNERASLLAPLEAALADLKLAARLDLIRAHAVVIEAHLAWFSGRRRKAEKLFAEAEALAQKEGAPWVLYAVHRGRAHWLREQGRPDAAIDQARIAEALAREHGAAYRLRWIREEFGLRRTRRRTAGASESELTESPSVRSEPSSHDSQPSPREPLRTLVRSTRTGEGDPSPGRQAREVLDDLLRAVRADRGFLYLATGQGRPEAPLEFVAGRTRHGENLSEANGDRSLLLEFVSGSSVQILDDDPASEAPKSRMGCPLTVEGNLMGALYLERASATGGFSEDDGETLSALAAQVPVALELARMLESREKSEKEQRNAEKMEAVGRLAGGIAHDFNNMLSAIQLATESIRDKGGVTPEVGTDLDAITDATERASELTRQLLAFSRGELREPEVFLLNDLVTRAMPVLTRLTGPAHEVVVRLEPNLYAVKADRGQLDRVLVNLVTNARDAMPDGGRLVVETANVVLDGGGPSKAKPGPYAVLAVSDTGVGMEPAVQAKIFEPFFTTKAERGGMGLGLATVYGIVTKSGGHIEVRSQPGEGTAFRIYLPKSASPVSLPAQPPTAPGVPRGTETILLVEDDPLVRQSLRRVLVALGYRVLPARTAAEALEIAREQLDHLDLLVTDVVMAGMNGLELARELHKRRAGLPVLYVSGYTAGVLADRGILGQRVEFLQKPVSQQVIATRVRELLDRTSRQVN